MAITRRRSRLQSVAVANAGTTSDSIDLGNQKTLLGFQTPAALTSTAVTFENSEDGGTTWAAVYNESTAYSITTAAGRYHKVNADVFFGCSLVRLVCGSAEGAARTLHVKVGEPEI